MIAIVDYGVGNLFSLKSSLEEIGYKAIITGDPKLLGDADRIILPGVGAFEDAIKNLRERDLYGLIIDLAKNGKPILGICLGMQLLFEKSYEYGEHKGLGLIKGEIRPISEAIGKELKTPHMGWNPLIFCGEKHPLFKYIKDGDCVYFVHSYHGVNCPSVIAKAEYGGDITAAVASGNIMGCQFHPEKSGEIGLNILRAFCEGEEI